MAATASCNFPAAFPRLPLLTMVKAFGSVSFFRPNSTPKSFRLRNSPIRSRVSKQLFCVPVVSCLGDNHSEASSELGPSHVTGDAEEATTVDLKLPRRSLLVHFTCNSCGERTQRLINRLAYERGTVFVQCAGCFKHHKLVDNLGLVVEYDLRDGSGMNSI